MPNAARHNPIPVEIVFISYRIEIGREDWNKKMTANPAVEKKT
jgi:hypothetical protein